MSELGGLHHLTAVTGDPAANVAFYTDVLGLRLVKKTVNQDDVSAYHLFYGDDVGHAGTEVTIRGLHAVGLTVRRLDYTAFMLTELLGFRAAGSFESDGRSVAVFETGPGGPGAQVYVAERPDLPPEQLGTGGVHHVAFRAP